MKDDVQKKERKNHEATVNFRWNCRCWFLYHFSFINQKKCIAYYFFIILSEWRMQREVNCLMLFIIISLFLFFLLFVLQFFLFKTFFHIPYSFLCSILCFSYHCNIHVSFLCYICYWIISLYHIDIIHILYASSSQFSDTLL